MQNTAVPSPASRNHHARLSSMVRIFNVFIPTVILLLLVLETAILLAIYTGAVYWQFRESTWIFLFLEDGWLTVLVVVSTLLGGLYLTDGYERLHLGSRILFFQQLCLVTGVSFLLQAVFSYTQLPLRMPRQAMLVGSLLCLLVLPAWRGLYGKLSLALIGAERVLLVGTGPLQQKLYAYLTERPEYGMLPLGIVAENPSTATSVPSDLLLGTLESAPRLFASLRPDRLVMGLAEGSGNPVSLGFLEMAQSGLRLEGSHQLFETLTGRVPLSQLPAGIIPGFPGSQTSLWVGVQAIYSWLIALTAIVVLSPVFVAAALAVRLSSSGPILYRQVRSGRNNVPFVLYKFRSMYTDAEKHTGAVWAKENDPRVTSVGRILRQYRIDELPQLFNVLRGQMSIVGPRPERPEFVRSLSEQIPFFLHRLVVKPGITGWAQINYKYGNSLEDTIIKLEYDLYYIKHLSPQLDFYIMFHTIKTILLTRGAY